MRFGGSFLSVARFGVLLLGATVLASTLKAQTATVSGTVLDSSGAIVTGATVTATNTKTGIDRTTHSTDTGAYTISSLPPSVYTFTFSKTGFKTVKFQDLTLTVDQALTLDCRFVVGDVQTTVEVNSAAVAPIDTETPTLSNVVEHQQMTELPLILRDPYQLVLLGPGVTQSDSGGSGQNGGVSVNGGRERNNNFLLDGADNNDTDVPGNLGGFTSSNPDATQEFRVLTNNFAPEYGRNNGAVIDVITRSGTNDFHGNVFYFGRWDALGARDYFNHQINPETADVAPKNPYVRNLYGGSVGGPIKKDRTFFFFSYQGDRFITAITNSSVVPSPAFRTGIFDYVDPNDPTQTVQHLNVTAGGANNATSVGLDPVIQKILSLYPNPNVINSDLVSGLAFFPSESREKDEDPILKIDHKINKDNNLYVRYTYNYFTDPNPFHTDVLPGDLGGVSSTQKIQGLAAGLTSTFGSTFINDFRFGANRGNLVFGCDGVSTFNSIDSAALTDAEGRGADFTLPVFANFGCQPLGDTNKQISKQGTYQWLDSMNKVIKSHTLKWGAEVRDVYSNNFTSFVSRAAFTFSVFSASGGQIPIVLDSKGNPEPAVAIEDEVSTLLGLVNSQAQTQFFNRSGDRLLNDELDFRQHELGFFWQDSWKIKSNLTLTYGLRWEWYGVPYEAHGNLANFFGDSSAVAPSFTFTPAGPGTGHQLFKDYLDNFEPRLGFAWDPFKTGRTSVRGGIGAFSDRIYGNLIEDIRGNPPFQPSVFNQPAFNNLDVNGEPTAPAQLQNQAAPGPLTPSPTVLNGAGIFPDIFANNIKPPLVVTWNLGVQRELRRDFTVDVNYVGNHGTRILRVVDGNPPQPALVAQDLTMGVPPSALQFSTLYFGAPGVPPVVNNNAFFDTFTDQTSGHSWYNGLQVQATQRAFHGLQIQGAYTFAHALDDSSDPLNPTFHNGNFPIDSFNLRREKGNSGFDTRHRGVVNFIYQPNIGRGKGHLSEGLVGRAFEGLELAGIAAFQTGLPYDIFGTADTLHTNFADRATIVNPALLKAVPAGGRVIPSTQVFTGENPAAFNPDDASIMPIPFGIPSPLERNQFYGTGINNWNFTLAKDTHLQERIDFQLRFEFYNVFNRTQFAKPGNLIGSPLLGYSTAQVGQNDGTTGARQVQIGGKLTF